MNHYSISKSNGYDIKMISQVYKEVEDTTYFVSSTSYIGS